HDHDAVVPAFSGSNLSANAGPIAGDNGWISRFSKILCSRAFSTFRIFPRIGRIACVAGFRADLAEPPAESPSTMYSSQEPGSLSWQSASLPGSDPPSRKDLRRVRSRACLAAIRALAAAWDFWTIRLAS